MFMCFDISYFNNSTFKTSVKIIYQLLNTRFSLNLCALSCMHTSFYIYYHKAIPLNTTYFRDYNNVYIYII